MFQGLSQQAESVLGDSGDSCAKGAEGHLTTTSQSLEEMAREERQENPSDLVHLDIGQLSDQTQQEEKYNSSRMGAFNDAPKDTVSLGGANRPVSFCESKNTVILCKKEGEAGLRSAEGSGTTSDGDCTVSLRASANGAVNPPSSGNTDEEAGMTSAGVVLDPAGVGSADSAHQEVQTAEEFADSAAAVAAAAGEAPASSEGLDVAMGQTECRNCAGAPERAKGQRQAEEGMAEPAERIANLGEKYPAKEESSSAAQPLLSGLNGTECSDGEDANVGVVPACDGAHADGDIGSVSVDLCKTSSNKETDVELCTAQVNGELTGSQGDASVTARQEVTASTGEAVNGVKVPACASKPAPCLEVHGSSESGEQEGQVEGGCIDGKSSLPSLEGSVETDGPDAEPENRDVDGSNESGAEPALCQDGGEVADHGDEAVESSEKEPVGTDTSSCRDGGSKDSAGSAQEVAACHPSAAPTGVKGEMDSSFKADTAQQSEREQREPASLPPEDVSTALAEEEPAQAGAEKAESASEQEGRSSKVESPSPLPREEGLAVSQEGDAAVAPPGQEAALQGNDPGSAPCARGADGAEANFTGTPSATHNEESKQKQEAAAARAGSAELAWQHGGEHGGVAAAWPGHHAGDEGSPEQGHSQQAEGGQAEPGQEAHVNGNEPVSSEELLAAVVKPCACSLGGPVVGSSNVDAGLKATVQPKEVCKAGAAVAAEGAMHGPASAEESLGAESDPCPNAGLNQDPAQTLQRMSPHSSTPELKDASEEAAPSDGREGEEVPRPVPIAPAAAYPEEQEGTESVLPRAALQPIAEEPTCDSDSSTDTVCPDTAPALPAAQGEEGLAEPHGNQSHTVPAVPFPPCSCRSQAVESLENVGLKSLVSADDASSLDKVPKMVKSFDAVVFAAETPCSHEIPAVEKVGLEPQTAVDAGASLNGQTDLSSSKKKNVSLAVQGAEPVTGRKNQLFSFFFVGMSLSHCQQRKGSKSSRLMGEEVFLL